MSTRSSILYGKNYHLFNELQGDDDEQAFVRLELDEVEVIEMFTSTRSGDASEIELKVPKSLIKEMLAEIRCLVHKEIKAQLLERQQPEKILYNKKSMMLDTMMV